MKRCKESSSKPVSFILAADMGSRRVSQRGRRRKPHASAAAHLPSVPIEAAVNMCLARAGFDLLRSAAFKQRMHAHIQRKLNVLRIPEYIQSIEVVAFQNAPVSVPVNAVQLLLVFCGLLRRRTLAVFAREQLEQEVAKRKCCR